MVFSDDWNGLFSWTNKKNSSEMERTTEDMLVYFISFDEKHLNETRGLMWRDGWEHFKVMWLD